MTDVALTSVDFSTINGWEEDNHNDALLAFLPGAQRMAETPYKTRSLGVNGDDLARAAAAAKQVDLDEPGAAKRFFERNFVPHTISTAEKDDGFLTGFFEPVVEASLSETKKFRFPLYARPPELIDVDEGNRSDHMSSDYRFGHIVGGVVQPYLDREAIQQGALKDRALEIAWLKDPVDVFFIHVQGAAKLALGDGKFLRVTFSAKAGHPYTSVAKILCAREGIEPSDMTADRLASWMRANLDQLNELLAHNRSYIFFKTVENQKLDEGPIAAAKVPLIAGRSMAVDRTIHTFGCPIWLTTNEPLPESNKPLARLMMAHDTGSAIIGAKRGDIFTGSGDAAGQIAGRVRHVSDMIVFVPKGDVL